MNIGDAFLMPMPRQPDNYHLWFVISDPTANSGTFVIVNVATNEFRAGRECVINPGDHKWVTRECFVAFGDALEITPELAQNIESLMGKTIKPQPCLTMAVLTRVIEAAQKSPAIPVGFKKYLAGKAALEPNPVEN